MSLIYTAPSCDNSNSTPLQHLHQRRNSVYLGGQVEAKSLSTLQRWGIKYILNVTPEKEAGITAGVPNYFEKTSSFVYKRIPVYDAATSNLLEHADKAVAFISTGLHHGSVLVHCQKGISRSATIVIFFLMRKVGMTLDTAMNLCKKRRPIVDPIVSFITQLHQYEEKCRSLGLIQNVHEEDETPSVNEEDNAPRPSKESLKRKATGPDLPSESSVEVISRTSSRSENDKVEIVSSTPSNTTSAKRKAIGPTMPSKS